MGLLDWLVGADAARQFRERMIAAQATAQAPRPNPAAAPRAASPQSPAAPIVTNTARPSAPADLLGLAGFDGSDFPTSILATAAEPAPPLLAAFANRPGLLAAIVFSEALAPPVALR